MNDQARRDLIRNLEVASTFHREAYLTEPEVQKLEKFQVVH